MGDLLDSKISIVPTKHRARFLEFALEVEEAYRHIADRRMSPKMNDLLQPVQSVSEPVVSEDEGIQSGNSEPEPIFIKSSRLPVHLLTRRRQGLVNLKVLHARFVHVQLVERTIPHHRWPTRSDPIYPLAVHIPMPEVMVAPEYGDLVINLRQDPRHFSIETLGRGCGRHITPGQ